MVVCEFDFLGGLIGVVVVEWIIVVVEWVIVEWLLLLVLLSLGGICM